MKKENFQRGITLIALVVTIIVLIILAGVSINMLVGDNGIITQAQNAKRETEEAQAREKLELALIDLQTEKYMNDNYNAEQFVTDYLTNKGMVVQDDIVMVDGYQFVIDRENLSITQSLGKGSESQTIEIALNSNLASDYTKATLSVEIQGSDSISKIQNNGTEESVPEKTDNKYTVTQYQVQNTDASTNSDVISKVVNINGQDKEIAITNEITISNLEIRNIDAGFYEKNIFDLSLKKTINRITVQNSKSKTVTEYNDATLAKVELKAKELAGTVVTIEYDLKITNEGEIPGQVNEIVDYIPNDLQFDEKSNPDWYLTREGELHNSSLTNTTINPGETQTIKLVLTKTMNENNLGNSINKAEIAKASNDLNIADIDSTYGNNVETEDDMGKAEVIISISTGKVVLAISLSLIVILMIVGGIIYIKRRKEV